MWKAPAHILPESNQKGTHIHPETWVQHWGHIEPECGWVPHASHAVPCTQGRRKTSAAACTPCPEPRQTDNKTSRCTDLNLKKAKTKTKTCSFSVNKFCQVENNTVCFMVFVRLFTVCFTLFFHLSCFLFSPFLISISSLGYTICDARKHRTLLPPAPPPQIKCTHWPL